VQFFSTDPGWQPAYDLLPNPTKLPASGLSQAGSSPLPVPYSVGERTGPANELPGIVILRIKLPARCRRFNLDINPRRQRQLVQSVDRLAGRLNDVNQPFMRADFELLPRLLIDVRAAQHRVTLDPGWKWNGTMNNGARPLGRIDNFRRRLIEYGMVVRFHANSDSFLLLPSHS